MKPGIELRFETASAIYLGKRENQEDALVSDFAIGGDFGFVVLSDGMGGHCAGDIASKVVVTEVYSELKLQTGNKDAFGSNMSDILRSAAESANRCVKELAREKPETSGMGATLVVPVLLRDKMFWISIGDSPLFLFRKGALTQLNEDHSMAPQIDFMVRKGILDANVGREHPDRNCLTSVLIGGEISRIDCPKEPIKIREGDIIVVASDGLQYLTRPKILDVLERMQFATSEQIADEFLQEIQDLNDPNQDNVSFTVIKVSDAKKKTTLKFEDMYEDRNIFLTERFENTRTGQNPWDRAANLRTMLNKFWRLPDGLTS